MVYFHCHVFARSTKVTRCRELFDDVSQLRSAGQEVGALRLPLSVWRSAGGYPDDLGCARLAILTYRAVYRHRGRNFGI